MDENSIHSHTEPHPRNPRLQTFSFVALSFIVGFTFGYMFHFINTPKANSDTARTSIISETPTQFVPTTIEHPPIEQQLYTPNIDRSSFYKLNEIFNLENMEFERVYIDEGDFYIERQSSLIEEPHQSFVAHIYSHAVLENNLEKDELVRIARSIRNLDETTKTYSEYRLAFLPYESTETIGDNWATYVGTTPIVWYIYKNLGALNECSGYESMNVYYSGIESNSQIPDEKYCIPLTSDNDRKP